MIIDTNKSSEMNKILSEISDDEEKYGFESFGGKTIPYIGWYWRYVDFTIDGEYYFGVLPPTKVPFDENEFIKIGFMENNKWGYDTVKADKEEWSNIKQLLIEVIEKPIKENFIKVNNAIQALSKKLPADYKYNDSF